MNLIRKMFRRKTAAGREEAAYGSDSTPAIDRMSAPSELAADGCVLFIIGYIEKLGEEGNERFSLEVHGKHFKELVALGLSGCLFGASAALKGRQPAETFVALTQDRLIAELIRQGCYPKDAQVPLSEFFGKRLKGYMDLFQANGEHLKNGDLEPLIYDVGSYFERSCRGLDPKSKDDESKHDREIHLQDLFQEFEKDAMSKEDALLVGCLRWTASQFWTGAVRTSKQLLVASKA